jgi:hypothetical protein
VNYGFHDPRASEARKLFLKIQREFGFGHDSLLSAEIQL